MSAAVCFAAMIPAMRAACSGSPFFTAPARMSRRASRDIEIDPRAIAWRCVTGLSATSTIFTRPRRSTWERRAPRDPRALPGIGLALREKERQALEGDRQIDALELHVGR